jgi:hypothetical protein
VKTIFLADFNRMPGEVFAENHFAANTFNTQWEKI